MKMPPDLVLFDCDGVLVDSEKITNDVLCRNLARHGLTITGTQLTDLFLGGTIMGVAERSRAMGARLPDSWVDDVYEEIFAALDRDVTIIDGIDFVLNRLDAAGIPYAVGSNGPHRKMEITLRRTGLAPRFQGRIYSREDVAMPKPAPDVYLKAAADAGIEPACCVVIEDSPNGARAGKAAGMTCFGFAAETPAGKLAPVCDRVFGDMGALPDLLNL
jgi:HAD superfamily hydrolase (TIGR01509 family)